MYSATEHVWYDGPYALHKQIVRRSNHMVWNTGEDKTKFTDVMKKMDTEFGGEEDWFSIGSNCGSTSGETEN